MTKSFRRALAGILLVIAMGAVAGCGNEDKIGYVDYNKAVTQSAKYQEIKAKILERNQQIKERLKTAEASQSAEEYKKTKANAEQEYGLFSSAMYKDLQNYVESNVSTIAKEKSLSIVVVKEAIQSGGTDITDDLIKKMGSDTSSSTNTTNQTSNNTEGKPSSNATTSEDQK